MENGQTDGQACEQRTGLKVKQQFAVGTVTA